MNPLLCEALPNQNLRLGILPAYTGHAVAALGGVKEVGHSAMISEFQSLPEPPHQLEAIAQSKVSL